MPRRGATALSIATASLESRDGALTVRESIAGACLCGSRLPLQVRFGLRSRTRPVVEGRWCCSEQCLKARVASFVRRGLPKHSLRQEHQHRVPLGLLLLSQCAITQEQLRFARDHAECTGERIGTVLVQHCGLSEQRLVQGLAAQWGCTAWDVKGELPDGMACVAPYAVLRAAEMLPLRVHADGTISVAFADAPDAQAVFAIRRIHDRPVDAGIAPVSDFAVAVGNIKQQEAVPALEFDCQDEADLVRVITRTIQRQAPVESRWARLHDMVWVRMWLEASALAGGLQQTEDVMDFIFHLRGGTGDAAKR